MSGELPVTVRYVKNGAGGKWWPTAKSKNQVHLGWKTVPGKLLAKPDFPKIERILRKVNGPRQGVTQDFNALRDLLSTPSQHLWITFEDGCMWWCTVLDGAHVDPDGESTHEGNFWLVCDTPWSNESLKGRRHDWSNLPGTVTAVAGFRATVCEPKAWREVLRIVEGEKDPVAAQAAEARGKYKQAVEAAVQRLPWKDFELLIDLILVRTGWARISELGKTRESIDLEVENCAADEIAFVQVKSAAGQKELDGSVLEFSGRRERYARMIFAVHSPRGELRAPMGLPVQLWTSDRIASLVVRSGLGEWVENRLA